MAELKKAKKEKVKKTPEQVKAEKEALAKMQLEAKTLKESSFWVIGFPEDWIVNPNFRVKFFREVLLKDEKGNTLDITRNPVKPTASLKKSEAFKAIIREVQEGKWKAYDGAKREGWNYYQKQLS